MRWIFGHLSAEYPVVVILWFSLPKASYADAVPVRNTLRLLRCAVPIRDTLWMSVTRCAACSRERVPVRYTLCLLPWRWLAFRSTSNWILTPIPLYMLYFKVDAEKSEQKFVLRARYINQHRFVFYILSSCDFRIKKIEEALQHRKEVGTSVSLVGHNLMQMTH